MKDIKVVEISQEIYDEVSLKDTLKDIQVKELTLAQVHKILFN